MLRPGYEVLDRMKGSDLVGIHYEPLYAFYPVERDYGYVVTGDCQHGGWHGHRAHRAGLWRRRHGGGQKYGLPVILTIDATVRSVRR